MGKGEKFLKEDYMTLVKVYWHSKETPSEYLLDKNGRMWDAYDGSVAPSLKVFLNNKNVRAILYSLQEAPM